MPAIKELGVVIAEREMVFRFDDGRIEQASLRVGKPFEYGGGYDWCSPYQLSTESHQLLFGMFGIDALQALELTMKTLRGEIEAWERSKNGKFYFLGEEGAAI